MGVGKTYCTVNILTQIFSRHKALVSTLILCPPMVIEVWAREFRKFSKVPDSQIVPVVGTGKQRLKIIQDNAHRPVILITNYETLAMAPVFAALKAYTPRVLVCDESHLLKSIESIRTKRTKELADRTEYRYILTGTPVLQSLLDIFSQWRILDKGATFGENYYLFRAKYFVDRNAHMARQRHFPDFRPKPGAIEAISRAIAPKSMVVKKSDVLDLPPLVRKEVFVELSAEQKKHYDAIKKDFITFLGSSVCATPLAITKGLRLQQIACGHLPVEDGNDKITHRFKDNPRLKALEDLLCQIVHSAKVIIWSHFISSIEDIRAVCAKVGVQMVEIHGGVSAANKTLAMDRFQTDSNCRVILANAASASTGISLTEASYMIYYSRSFSLGDDLQSEARAWRSGSEKHKSIIRIDLIAKDTIDEVVVGALKRKEDIGTAILRGIK